MKRGSKHDLSEVSDTVEQREDIMASDPLTNSPGKTYDLNPDSPIMSPKRSSSWAKRTFSKIKPGSVRGSIFTLISTSMGAACLSLPSRMSNSGLVLHLLIMFLIASVAYLSAVTIARASEHYSTYHYSGLISKVFGRRWGEVIDFIIIIYIYGTLISYQILVGEFVPSVLGSLGVHGDETLVRDLAMVAVNVVVIVPLGMLRNLSALRFASIFSVVTLIMIALVLVSELPFFNHHYQDLHYFDFNLSIFSTYAVTLYAFVCHCNVPIVHSELIDRSVRRMSKAAFRAISIVLCGYIIIGLFGYFSVPDGTPSIITQRKTPPGIQDDWVMVVARTLFTITVVIAIPINIPPLRNSVTKFCFRRDQPSLKLHVGITLISLLTALIIAIFYPSIIFLFNFLGGFCASILVVLIPSLFHYKLSDKPWTSPLNLTVLGISTLLTLIGFTSVVISIVQLA